MAEKYDYRALRGFIKEYFGSNSEYAKFLKISNTALYERLAGNIPFRQTEIDATARHGDLDGEGVMRLFFTKVVRKSV